MRIESGGLSLRVTDIEITREKTSFLLESQPLNERAKNQFADFLVNELGASEVKVSSELIEASEPSEDGDGKVLSWIADWEHNFTLIRPTIMPINITKLMRN